MKAEGKLKNKEMTKRKRRSRQEEDGKTSKMEKNEKAETLSCYLQNLGVTSLPATCASRFLLSGGHASPRAESRIVSLLLLYHSHTLTYQMYCQ